MMTLAQRLVCERTLTTEQFRALIELCDDLMLDYLRQEAVRTARGRFGLGIFVRGLIEISSFCRNNCYYCGLRRSNPSAERSRLSHKQIMECCEEGYNAGLRTFVLQGGEDGQLTDEWLENIITDIRHTYPDAAITLSLGERCKESYERLYQAGATRYLLRHEAADKELYCSIHPAEMSYENRIACIENLKSIGYQTGMGMMIGVKGQSIDSLVQDLQFLERLQPQMIGIGPFIPHPATPYAKHPAGDIDKVLNAVAITRLLLPNALIPATTALSTLSAEGHRLGILAGANVIMPNLSPADVRSKYAIYAGKAATGTEAVEGIKVLEAEISAIGYTINYAKADYNDTI